MLKEFILLKILRVGVYAVALVPLVIFSQFLSPFHFGKVIVFRSIVELMLIFYVMLVLLNKSYLPKFNKITWSFLAFVLAFSLTTLTSSQVYQSFWGGLERMGGLWTFWHYFVLFVITISVLRDREDWFKLFRVMVVVGLLSAFYGYLQKTDISWIVGGGGRTRIFGTIGNAALFAGYQILIYFLAIIMFLRKSEGEKWKALYAITAFCTGLAVLMTAVRGSLVAIVLGTLVFASLYFWQNRTPASKKIFYGVAMFIALFILFAFSFKNSNLVQNSAYLRRVTNFSPSNFTIQTRFWAWQAGLKGWSESPQRIILGWGPENFNIPFSKYFNPKFYDGPGSETLFDRAHNMFVEVLVTMGLVGFLAYLSIFASAFLSLKKKLKEASEDRLFAMGFMAMIVAYMIHNAFIFDTSANFITFFSILGFISFIVFPPEKKIDRAMPRLSRGLTNSIVAVLAVAVVVLIYKTAVLPSYANYATTRAIVAAWNGDFNGSVDKYKESLSYDVPGKYDYRNKMAQFILDAGTKDTSKYPNYLETVRYALEEEKKNEADFPIDYLPKLYISRLYITLGKGDPKSPYNDEALKKSLEALALSKTFVRTYFEVAQAYLNKEDYKSALEYFQRAVDLNPNVGLSHWYVGIVQFRLNDTVAAKASVDKAIELGAPLGEVDYLRVVALYLTYNDYDKIVWAYERLVQMQPKNAKYFASLAVAYQKVNKLDEAAAAARQAVVLDPTFKPEADMFLRSIGR